MEGKNNKRRQQCGTALSETTLSIPLSSLPFAENGVQVSCIYPQKEATDFTVNKDILTVCFEKPVMARLFEITAN